VSGSFAEDETAMHETPFSVSGSGCEREGERLKPTVFCAAIQGNGMSATERSIFRYRTASKRGRPVLSVSF
jgi:hypothetical protein